MNWWHSILSVGMLVFTAAAPVLQGLIAAHPLASTIVGVIWSIVGHLAPSPISTTTTGSLGSK